MCGIAGVFGLADKPTVEKMVDAQAQRGPDDRGVWCDPDLPVTLGQTRLAILDLSPAGHQPMSYWNERLWITYNGEIYNFVELRNLLQEKGYEFRSKSDTEVILASYLEWGPTCVHHLRGMFAFALVDRRPETNGPSLFLARDRLGIKPLLYFEHNNELWFASELRGLRASGRLEPRVDPEALLDYLAVGSVFQPRTFLQGVHALPPGHWMTIRNTQRQQICYWDVHEQTTTLRQELGRLSQNDAVARTREAIEEATRYHLVADVSVGAFLSGGIDSTAVVGMMSRIGGKTVKTFSVGFEQAHQRMDERKYAQLAAQHLDTDHHEVVITDHDSVNLFPQVVQSLDQPSVDGTNTWIVSNAAQKVVKVALSGLGGDELFAGYDHFQWLVTAMQKQHRHKPKELFLLEGLQRLRPTTAVFRRLLEIAAPSERFSMLRRLVRNENIPYTMHQRWIDSFRARLADRHARWLQPDADPIQQISYAEIHGYLLSTLLRDCDVMSMAHGLEVRPVLLDHRLVELAYSLPSKHKLRNGKGKLVLIDAVREFIPPLLQRRPKMGFEMPVTSWMATALSEHFESLLQTETARQLFLPRYLAYLQRSLRKKKPPRTLWAWGILLAWLEQNRIPIDQAWGPL
ncbi:MAG: asparagine synthase (glutamine-hydrolyzing) [Pseudomonadota bacterium]